MIDPKLKAFLEKAEALAQLECALWGHRWRVLPFSSGPVTVCVRCGEQDTTTPGKPADA